MGRWLFRGLYLFPARAGVILVIWIFSIANIAFPRACGGDPAGTSNVEIKFAFSPRVRG